MAIQMKKCTIAGTKRNKAEEEKYIEANRNKRNTLNLIDTTEKKTIKQIIDTMIMKNQIRSFIIILAVRNTKP